MKFIYAIVKEKGVLLVCRIYRGLKKMISPEKETRL